VDVLIAPRVGPELLTGSTRLKAATATKLILNMLTVASMVQLGKVYGHWMVDVRPTSRKLKARAIRIIHEVTGASPARASRLLRQAQDELKPAIVMGALQVEYRRAKQLLVKHKGRLRPILG
jgi:N-acetylmuramic acid 6-phosphate etherase